MTEFDDNTKFWVFEDITPCSRRIRFFCFVKTNEPIINNSPGPPSPLQNLDSNMQICKPRPKFKSLNKQLTQRLVVRCGIFYRDFYTVTLNVSRDASIAEIHELIIDDLHKLFLATDPHYPRCKLSRLTLHGGQGGRFYWYGTRALGPSDRLDEQSIRGDSILRSMFVYDLREVEDFRRGEIEAEVELKEEMEMKMEMEEEKEKRMV